MTARPVQGPLLLGVDIGSSRTKALLLDGAGEEVGAAIVPTPFVTSGDRTEATSADLHDSLAHVLDRLGDGRHQVAAVGVAGIAESGAPLDAAGRPLAPVLAWHDRRGEEVADRLAARFGRELSRRIGQRIGYKATAAKLGWLLDHGLEGMTTWLGVPELGLLALTGARATELSLAARTGCFDIGSRQWLPAVAEAAGFDVGVFPDVLRAGTAMGHVSADGAVWSGVPTGVPVTVAGHDHLAGVVGSGASVFDLTNSVGTAETVIGRSAILPDVSAAVAKDVAVNVFPGGDGWAVLASAARSGLAVDTVAAALGRSPADLDAATVAAAATSRAAASHANAGAATRGSLLDAPGLLESLRRRQPPVLPTGDDQSTAEVWATLLDALATCTGGAVAAVTALLGPRERLVVFGGGAASRPWLAAKAHHAALPVWRSTTRHAVARGAAVMAGVAAGWWPTPADAPRPNLEPVFAR